MDERSKELAIDSYLRRLCRVAIRYHDKPEFAAEMSCTSVQYGSHIDSLPVEQPLPPIKFSMIETKERWETQ